MACRSGSQRQEVTGLKAKAHYTNMRLHRWCRLLVLFVVPAGEKSIVAVDLAGKRQNAETIHFASATPKVDIRQRKIVECDGEADVEKSPQPKVSAKASHLECLGVTTKEPDLEVISAKSRGETGAVAGHLRTILIMTKECGRWR